VRLSAIGDLIHGLPVANALRARLPGAKIGWLIQARAGPLREAHPPIDTLVRVPHRWLKSPTALWRLRQQLHSLQWDVTIDLQGLYKSAAAAWLSGARRRIGFASSASRELSWVLNNELVEPTATHIVDRNLELLKPLGITHPGVEFRLPERADDAATIDRFLVREGLGGGFAVVNPGAGWPSKLWPADRYAAVARHLAKRHHLNTVVVWAGDQELRLAEEIVSQAGPAAHLAVHTSLTELVALLRRARLMIASDTGPLHMAVAVGTPSVGLFGPMPAERNGAYGPQHISLQEATLTGGSRKRRTASNLTMKAIGVDLVADACDKILARENSAGPAVRVA
jgi:lipopolysaccharide heptosyltransferase I